jgi:trehalose/maltose transport system substrate-binding protein
MQVRNLALAATIGAIASVAVPGQAQAVAIRIACGSGPGLEHCKQSAQAWADNTGNTIEAISTPNSSTEQLALFQQLLAAGSSDIDILMIDVVWPGILAQHLVDLIPHSKGAEGQHFPAIVENNTVEGKLVAMPWYTDAGLLYYRKDLLEQHGEAVPETWEALTASAEKIQKAEQEAGNDKFWGYVWQGRAYEGLTCDALEWVASYNGGTIVEPDGKISIDNPEAATAIEMAKGWIDTISPPGVLNYSEEEARGVFQSGNAMYMRNWPYAWSLSQSEDSPVKGKVGMTVLPKGGADGRHAATLGGWQLAVSKYSANQEAAIDLALYLAGPEVQKKRAIDLSLLPTIESLYEDADVVQANPFFADMKEVLASSVARPSTVTGGNYNQASSEFFNAVFTVLSGRKSAEGSLKELNAKLTRLGRGGKW